VNAVAPGIVNNRKFSQILGDVMHRPSLVPVPTFVLEAMFGEGATIVTGGQNAIPERTLSFGYNFAFTDPKHALTDLLE
jgi:NAD dependent epimerase/dehydratase family enzyme